MAENNEIQSGIPRESWEELERKLRQLEERIEILSREIAELSATIGIISCQQCPRLGFPMHRDPAFSSTYLRPGVAIPMGMDGFEIG